MHFPDSVKNLEAPSHLVQLVDKGPEHSLQLFAAGQATHFLVA